MEKSLEGEQPHGPAHAENVAKQLVGKNCQSLDKDAHAGVLKWALLKRLLQCTRILSCGPRGLETLVRREPDDPKMSTRPFDFPAEIQALQTWVKLFSKYRDSHLAWLKTPLGQAKRDTLSVAQGLAVDLRKAEHLFVMHHLKEVERLFKVAPGLGEVLDKADKAWEAIQEDKNKFKLTDDVEEKGKSREAEEARIEEALAGSFTGAGSGTGDNQGSHDEF